MRHDGGDPSPVNAQHLYVHVPFCARRCVYCDFSIAVRSRVPVDEYLGALHQELALRHASAGLRHANAGFRLATLYFGGGTPSRLGPQGISQMMGIISDSATLEPGAEVTLEANPEDVTAEAVRAWLDAGVTRVSLGVQSFQDAVLSWMHRTHDAASALRAVHVLREVGLVNLSIDLIFAAPSSVNRSWERDLETVAELALPHVSVYGLTVESHTPLGRWVARHDVTEAPEDRFEQEYLLGDSVLTSAGLEHYEVSNYGKPGAHSRHNWAYWQRRAYGGLGPSAHEFDGRVRRWNVSPYVEWLGRLSRGQDPLDGAETLTRDQIAAEQVYLGLRTKAGARLSDNERARVQPWISAGWATMDDDETLRLTPAGWLRLDALASDLTAFRSRY